MSSRLFPGKTESFKRNVRSRKSTIETRIDSGAASTATLDKGNATHGGKRNAPEG